MMWKLDELLSSSNRENRHAPTENSQQATDKDGTRIYAGAQLRSRTSFESNHRERPRAAPSETTVSQDTTMYAPRFEPLNISLETFITKLSKSTERGQRSRGTLKKPKSYKDESDGCIDFWIEVNKLHFEEENLSKKQECSALTSNIEGTALSCVMVKRFNDRASARKIFDILLNRFGSGVQGHQAMVSFEKRRQRDDESIDKFLDEITDKI